MRKPEAKRSLRYQDRTVRSVSEALGALKEQSRQRGQIVWFRGHGVKSWKLVPTLARIPSHLKAEGALIKRFMQNAVPHVERPPQNEWEWMFLMQHHGAETRLLDWSESPLAALYFAVFNKAHAGGGAVWCLDPLALNEAANLRFPFKIEIPAFGLDKVLESYLPSNVQENPSKLFTVAIVGPRNTPRMAAQLGTFTINHRLHEPIEEIGDGQHVWRWIIPGKAKRGIRRELAQLGYTALTLFPELDRVADVTKELLDEI
jgi:hypothetical protein